jgi:hypothetical protein
VGLSWAAAHSKPQHKSLGERTDTAGLRYSHSSTPPNIMRFTAALAALVALAAGVIATPTTPRALLEMRQETSKCCNATIKGCCFGP